MKKIPDELIEKMTQRLVDEFQPEKIILFGSHAWGVPDEDSDLGLLVIVSKSNLRPTQRATRAYRCLRGLMAPKDILVKTHAEVEKEVQIHASLVSEILERGKVLYG